ncbi:MAG: DUF4173 domain-containing protein [Acidobacteria bacterium]|nr:DUF4173 domain-containing protein [Acidobacteriota bacterium]
MNARTKLGLGVLVTGLTMGVLGDALLREGPWGLNLLVWIAALVLAVLALAGWGGIDLKGDGRWLLIPAILFAGGFVWRDSRMLNFLSFVALATALALAAFRAREGQLRVAGILEYALGMALSGIMALIGIPLLAFNDVEWKEIGSEGRLPRTMAVARGFLLAVPLLIVFGSLFMEADAVFENLIKDIFYIDFVTLVSHMLLAAFFAWVSAGYLRGLLVDTKTPVVAIERPQFLGVGIIEIGVVLGAINLLFLSFVIVQFRYLFGGHELVQATTGLTYAQYARRGFFELVTVAVLVLPLLLVVHWLLRKENPAHARIFRVLAIAQIALLFVIMASAAQRMRLYQSEYGLTELRLYTLAFIGWLAVVFLWFMGTVLRGRRDQFVFGAMVAGFLSIGALHLMNPDALIIRTNLARVDEDRSFDAKYAARRNADAVPALIAGLPRLSHEDQCTVAGIVLHRWPPPPSVDWRTWNLARSRARRMVRENLTTLRAVKSSCPKESQPDTD